MCGKKQKKSEKHLYKYSDVKLVNVTIESRRLLVACSTSTNTSYG